MIKGDRYKVVDPNGRLGDYTLVIGGSLLYGRKEVGSVTEDGIVTENIWRKDPVTEEFEWVGASGKIQNQTLVMDSTEGAGDVYQLEPIS